VTFDPASADRSAEPADSGGACGACGADGTGEAGGSGVLRGAGEAGRGGSSRTREGANSRTGEGDRAGTERPALARKRVEWGRALRRTPVSVWDDDVTDWAAALTYYAMLALLPALLVTVSAVGLAGRAAIDSLIRNVTALLPAQSGGLMEGVLRDMAARDERSTAWLLAAFGTAGALWFSSSYLSVFRRALHSMLGVKDRRPVWRTVPATVLTAVILLATLVATVFVLMLSGELARKLGQFLGVGGALTDAWNTLRWPMLLCLSAVLALLLFRTGPRELRGVRNGGPGGALGVLLWLVASGGFALYASHVPTYHRLYGSLAGIVVFLVWLWFSNLALLCGAQFNAELAKQRRARRALGPDEPDEHQEHDEHGEAEGPKEAGP